MIQNEKLACLAEVSIKQSPKDRPLNEIQALFSALRQILGNVSLLQ